MTSPVIRIGKDEPVTVAARTLEHYQIGALPVCDANGTLCGLITDRDLVLRCMAANRNPEQVTVGDIMTGQIAVATPDMDAREAAKIMGVRQVRRLPVVDGGQLCGMLSLGDLANAWEHTGVEEALSQISSPFRGK